MKLVILLTLAFAPTARPGTCATVHGPRVYARDLVPVSSPTAILPGDLDLGYAPKVGAQRTVTAATLARSAAQAGLGADLRWESVCIRTAERRLSLEELQTTLREALDGPGEIRIVDYFRGPIADGPVRFPRAWLQATGYWRGRAADDSPIWIRIDPSRAGANPVQKDQIIEAEVRAGAAVVRITATAEGSGSVGQSILVRDGEGHRFRAVVSAPGKVEVTR